MPGRVIRLVKKEILPPIVASGIALPGYPFSGQTTSYRTGDEGWRYINGWFERINPTNPEYYQILDFSSLTPFYTLLFNNRFGNTDRFTDDLGGQTYANGAIIDNLYELMYAVSASGALDWNGIIDDAVSSSFAGYSGWFELSSAELTSILNREIGLALDYFPFSYNKRLWTSTTRKSDPTKAYELNPAGQQLETNIKTDLRPGIYVRKLS